MAMTQEAPGRLETVRRFLNTIDVDEETEELADPAAASRWLAESGLTDRRRRVDPAEFDLLLAARTGLRAIVASHAGDPLDLAAVAELDRAAAECPLRLGFDGEASRLNPVGSGGSAAIATLLVTVHDASVDGTWARLKLCRNHGCAWVFYDCSRNRSATWCSMAVCGNRAKAQAFRRRHG